MKLKIAVLQKRSLDRQYEKSAGIIIEKMEEAAEKAYIGTCVNVYTSLVLDRTGQFALEQKKVWNLMKEHKEWIPCLSRKQQFLANLILYWPIGYKPIYRFYAKYFLKNCYE